MRIREPLKTVALVLLIAGAFVLSANAWFYEYLVPSRIFNPADTLALFNGGFSPSYPDIAFRERDASYDIDAMLSPSSIVISSRGKRRTVTGDSAMISQTHSALKDDISWILSHSATAKISDAGEGEWISALSRDSILVDFGNDVPLSLYAEYLGVGGLKVEDVPFRYMLLCPDPETGKTLLCLKSARSDNTIFYQNGGGAAEVEQTLLDELQKNGAPNQYLYAFEAAATPLGGRRIERTGMEAEHLIAMGNVKTPVLEGFSPLGADADPQAFESVAAIVLRAFGHNAAVSGLYTAGDGSRVYVENFSTLSFSPEGVIEYKVTGVERGIEIKPAATRPDGVFTHYDLALAAWRLLNSLGRNILGGEAAFLTLSGAEPMEGENGWRLYFSYRSGGMDIFCTGIELEKGCPTVIEIVEGSITRARIYSRAYRDTGEEKTNLNMYLAMDLLKDKGAKGGDLFLMYRDEGENGPVYTSYVSKKRG